MYVSPAEVETYFEIVTLKDMYVLQKCTMKKYCKNNN